MNRSSLRFTACAAVLAASSCVTQERYDEAFDSSVLYQRLYHDSEQHARELEVQNQRLRSQLGIVEGVAIEEGGLQLDEIDDRLTALKGILSGMGRGPEDVSLVPVDGGYAYGVRDSVLFDSGSSELRPAGRELLARLGKEINLAAFEFVWVRGHTDSDPVKQASTRQRFPHGNMQLSAERAVSVFALLKDTAGIPEGKMGVVGFGPNRPVVPNDSSANKQRNRRVEIIVLDEAPLDSEVSAGG